MWKFIGFFVGFIFCFYCDKCMVCNGNKWKKNILKVLIDSVF